jgi:hypothetical protein
MVTAAGTGHWLTPGSMLQLGASHQVQKAARWGPTYAQQLLLCPSWMHVSSLAAQRSNVPGTMSSALQAKTHICCPKCSLLRCRICCARTPEERALMQLPPGAAPSWHS